MGLMRAYVLWRKRERDTASVMDVASDLAKFLRGQAFHVGPPFERDDDQVGMDVATRGLSAEVVVDMWGEEILITIMHIDRWWRSRKDAVRFVFDLCKSLERHLCESGDVKWVGQHDM